MRLLQKDCHPRMPLSGIQGFQSLKIWIPDQKRFGNDSFRIFARGSLEWFYAPPLFQEGLGVVRFWLLTLFLSLKLMKTKGNHP